MFRSYALLIIRNFGKNRWFSIINVFVLALAISTVFFIVQYLVAELSYDKFHSGADNIYRVIWFNDNPQTRTPHPLSYEMKNDFPEVEAAVSLSPLWGPGLTRQTFSIRNNDKNIQFDEQSILAVDTSFFDVFTSRLKPVP